jgi:hypothetical protein
MNLIYFHVKQLSNIIVSVTWHRVVQHFVTDVSEERANSNFRVLFPKTQATIYQTKQRQIPDDNNIQSWQP